MGSFVNKKKPHQQSCHFAKRNCQLNYGSKLILLLILVLVSLSTTITKTFHPFDCVSIITVVHAFDSCNICRAPNIVNNPDASVTTFILQLLGLDNFLSCRDLNTIGENGLLPDTVCLLIQSRAQLRRTCGCALPGAPFLKPIPV
jgi:hypothetical protein